MNFRDKLAGEMDDPVLTEALKNFKASVDAWSDTAYSRPRVAVDGRVRRGGWRLAASWALGCVLAAGSLAGGVYERHHRQELARIGAMKTAAQIAAQERAAAEHSASAAQKVLEEQAAIEPSTAGGAAGATNADADLMATVDTDVSRQVPSAMEPLAQLMDDNGNE